VILAPFALAAEPAAPPVTDARATETRETTFSRDFLAMLPPAPLFFGPPAPTPRATLFGSRARQDDLHRAAGGREELVQGSLPIDMVPAANEVTDLFWAVPGAALTDTGWAVAGEPLGRATIYQDGVRLR
jgi:hypothetical protein